MRASKLGKRPNLTESFGQTEGLSAQRQKTVAPTQTRAGTFRMTRKGGRVTADQVKTAGGPAQLIAQLVSDLVKGSPRKTVNELRVKRLSVSE